MTIELKIRRIKSGETLVAEFESLADAETWLRDRPAFVDVLGTVGNLGAEKDARLRVAMRALDAEESAEIASQDAAAMAAAKLAIKEEQAAATAATAARSEEMVNADPGRPMHVAWVRGQALSNGDESDSREVPEIAVKAVAAWVSERDTWVHPRDQYVATANLMVWPGAIPGGDEADRVQPGGQFTTLSGLVPELN